MALKRNPMLLEKIILTILKRFYHKTIRLPAVFAFLKRNTVKKTLNYLHNEFERRTNRISLKSKPFLLYMEMTNRCNFRCPFCFTGKNNNKIKGEVSKAGVQKVLDQIGEYVYLATLHGLGEPLLNKEFDEVVSMLHQRNIFTVISTNVSLLNEAMAGKIVQSKLDYLILSIDGASQMSYEKYRKGGDFAQVMENTKNFMRIRRALNSSTPFVEWQFIVFSHNYNEMDKAKSLAREAGVDYINFIPGIIEDQSYAVSDKKYESRACPLTKRTDCKSLWNTLVPNWNGDLAACCWDYSADSDFGNVFLQDFRDIWNNDKYQNSRRLVACGDIAVCDTICKLCVTHLGQSPSLLKTLN